MSEYRREDTASWDAQEVRRAQEGRQSAPARHPQSHHTRRRRRNPVLGLGGYLDIGLIDTMKDLMVNFLGAVVFSIIGYFYVKEKGKGDFAAQFIPKVKREKKDEA